MKEGVLVTGEDSSAPLNMHKLTPLDIHNKEFRKSFRGYCEDEVDEFLDLVVAEFERILRLNEDLQASIAGLESRLEHYKGLEETLKNAILLAQKAADEIRESAVREAGITRKEAVMDAERIRNQAQEALRESYEEIERNKNRLRRFQAEMRTFLQSTLDFVIQGTESLEDSISEGRKAK
jgi:cell division initiation protein